MASTNRPLDESTATLVAPDDHLHAKDLLSTPTNTSTAISSGTVSDEEPSTPEPFADVPVSVLCGWPHAGGPDGKTGHQGTTESGWPHEDDPKDPAAKDPKGRPDDGSGGWPHPGDSDKPDPAKWHTLKSTSNDSTVVTSKDDSVSVLCGWPHAGSPDGKPGHEVTKESGWPHEDDPKDPAAKIPDGLTSLGSSDKPNPGDSSKDDPAKGWPDGNASKPDPAKLHTLDGTSNDGIDSAAKNPKGWPLVGGVPDNGSDFMPKPGDSSKPDPAKWHKLKGTSNDGSDSTSQVDFVSALCGWPHDNNPKYRAAKNPGVPDNGSDLVPEPGDSSKPDPANGWPNGNASKPDPAKRGRQGQRGNVYGETGTDFTSKNESGWPHVDDPKAQAAKNPKGWPPVGGGPGNGDMPNPGDPSKNDPAKIQPDSGSDQTQPETAGPERRKPGTFGPEGQPPWGVKNLAATAANATSLESPEGQPPWGIKNLGAAVNATGVAGPEGQPPWGIKNLDAAVNATGVAGPEGQPPWGIKNLDAAVNAKGVAGPEGQPPWGVKNLVASDGGPEGQPPWGTKGRAATTTTGGNESGKGDVKAQNASA